ncbi:MAG: nucleoid-associated protein [Sediminibacterium sp.]
MNDLSTILIKSLIVHQAGDAAQGGRLFLSEKALETNQEELNQVLTHFMLKSLNEAEQYRLDKESNIIYSAIRSLFEDDSRFLPVSQQVAEHFHLKSSSAFAKSGELCVVHFQQVPFADQFRDAIGIFHSGTRETFLKPSIKTAGIELLLEDGIDLKKPERAVLILKQDAEEGFLAYSYESTASKQADATFWKQVFLKLNPVVNSYHNTNAALGMCKLFISNELNEQFETTKADQIDMLQRSMEYFKTHDNFQLEEFGKEVLHHPEVIGCFNDYKQQYEVARQVNIEDQFDINLAAVQKQQRFFKSILKLDKNFHVYIHGRKDLIEKGFDERAGKHYYKLYFDEEK